MEKRKSILEKLTAAADLPDEAIPRLPLIEIAGEQRVLVENHMGVLAYSTEQITVKVRYGAICICGAHLELARMIKGQLVITGRVSKVELLRRNG